MSDDLALANAAAENALLSCMINLRLATSVAVSMGLQRSDYAWEVNALIHDAIMRVFERGEAVDQTVLLAELSSAGQLTTVGGEAVINQIAASPHSLEMLSSYVNIVRDRAVRRRIMHAFERGTTTLHREPDLKKAIEDVQSNLHRSIDSYMDAAFNGIDAGSLKNVYELARENTEYMPFPFEGANRNVRGRARGTLTIIGGYSSDGKSTVALSSVVTCARAGLKTAFICLEMTQEQITLRLLSFLTGISTQVLEEELDMDQQLQVDQAFAEIAGWDMTLYCDPSMTVQDIRNVQMSEKYDYICIDYLQRFDFTDWSQVPRMAKQLKNIALSTNCAIDLLSQLTPKEIKVGGNPFTRPDNHSLYGGKATAHEADNILFIWATRILGEDGVTWKRTGMGLLICTKFRGNQTEWQVPMRFNGRRVAWEEAA